MERICRKCNSDIPQYEVNYANTLRMDGYFCEVCEYYHYFNNEQKRPIYRLYLEEGKDKEDVKVLSQQKIKLSKRLSPLRYPGGKTKLIDFMYSEMKTLGNETLYSPFVGGASVELALLDAGLVDKVVLNDLDKHLMNFYRIVFYETKEFIRYIANNPLTISLYETAHQIVLSDFDELTLYTNIEKAFYYLINNRCSFSGIYNAGRMGGKKGNLDKLGARWNEKNISKRIEKLGSLSSKVTLSQIDYKEFIEENAWDNKGMFFIDPPYVEKAKDIYRHAFDIKEHRMLFNFLTTFWESYPASDFFVFYDNHPLLRELLIPEDIEVLARRFSIAN